MVVCCRRAQHRVGKPAALLWPQKIKGQIKSNRSTEHYYAVSNFIICPLPKRLSSRNILFASYCPLENKMFRELINAHKVDICRVLSTQTSDYKFKK
jgi:hypothetical protein